jgi:hypothetical protein
MLEIGGNWWKSVKFGFVYEGNIPRLPGFNQIFQFPLISFYKGNQKHNLL